MSPMIYDARKAREAMHKCPVPFEPDVFYADRGTVWQCPECDAYRMVKGGEDGDYWGWVEWWNFDARRRIREAEEA